MSRRRVQAVLLIVPALWGLVFVGINKLLDELNVFQIVSLRYGMIVVAFGVTFVVAARTRPVVHRSRWRLVIYAGLMGVPLSQLGIVYAQRFLAPTLAAILVTLAPAVTAVVAALILNQRMSRRQGVGFVVALVGAIVVIVLGAGGDASFEISNVAGAAVGLITPVAWALYTVALKQMAADQSTFGTVGLTLLVGSLFLIPFVPTAASGATRIGGGEWAWIAYLAVGGTFIAYLLWYWSLKYLDASETAAYLYLVPVFALGWSLVLLGEAPSLGALAGGVVVITGVWMTQTAGRRTAVGGSP